MRLSISLLALLVSVAFQRKFDVVERVFEVYLAASRLKDHRAFDLNMLINDPQEMLGVSRPRLCETQTDVLAETERNKRKLCSAILSSLTSYVTVTL